MLAALYTTRSLALLFMWLKSFAFGLFLRTEFHDPSYLLTIGSASFVRLLDERVY